MSSSCPGEGLKMVQLILVLGFDGSPCGGGLLGLCPGHLVRCGRFSGTERVSLAV